MLLSNKKEQTTEACNTTNDPVLKCIMQNERSQILKA